MKKIMTILIMVIFTSSFTNCKKENDRCVLSMEYSRCWKSKLQNELTIENSSCVDTHNYIGDSLTMEIIYLLEAKHKSDCAEQYNCIRE